MNGLLLRRIAVASLFVAVCGAGRAADGVPALIDAVRGGDPASIRKLIDGGADVNAAQGDGAVALHWAAHLDNVSAAAMLIEAGADVNSANDDAATPLQVACANRDPAMIELLLKAGADANAELINGETVLMTCSRAGDAQSVQALLAGGARVNEKESGHDQTALMWAAAQDHSEVVKLLLEAGADLRARSTIYSQTVVDEETQRAGREELNYDVLRGGSTPLLFAARNGGLESARLLLQAGADANETLPDGMSALVLASHSGHGDLAALLLEHGADANAFGTGYTALHAAVLRGDGKLVSSLLEHGADPDIRMTKGTPIRRQTTDYNLPKTLIGATPYLLAALFVEADIMRDLAAGGADVSLTMPNGTSGLLAAAGVGARRARNRRGISVIDVGGQLEPESQVLAAVAVALELEGDPNARNDDGDTAIHAAAARGYDQVIRFLAEQGADVNAKNAQGRTPLGDLLARTASSSPAAASDEDAAVEESPTVTLLRELGGKVE